MEKNLIDELFSSQLRNHEQIPSERANRLFEERLLEKNKKGIFFFQKKAIYWSAAAALFVALSATLWVNNTETVTSNSNAQLASVPKKVNDEKVEISALKKNNSIANREMQPQIALSASDFQTTKQSKEAVRVIDTSVHSLVDETLPNKEVSAVVASVIEEEYDANFLENSSKDAFQKSLNNEETLIVITEYIEEDMYLPEIDEDSPVTITYYENEEIGTYGEINDNGKTFFAKVLHELRNFKHGEKVDVNGLSYSSQQILVRSNDGFIESEKRELQDRWQKLRGIFEKNI